MRGLYVVSHLAPYRDCTVSTVNRGGVHKIETYAINRIASTHKEWNYKNGEEAFSFFRKERTLPLIGTWNSDVRDILKLKKYDFFILGGYRPATLTYLVLYLIFYHKSFIYTTDKKQYGTWFGDHIAKWICHKACAVWVPGKASKKYLMSLGIEEAKIYEGCYTNSHIKLVQNINKHKKDRNLLRKELGIMPDEFAFLFIGKLIPTRKIKNLVQAMQRIPNSVRAKVVVIGDGPDSEIVMQSSRIIHIKECFFDSLYKFYLCADAYIHPGNEPYSLAVADAAVAGLPIIATEGVGASCDVIENGKNGIIVPEDNVEALTEAVCKIYYGEFDKNTVKKMQQHMVEVKDIEGAAKELIRAIERCKK